MLSTASTRSRRRIARVSNARPIGTKTWPKAITSTANTVTATGYRRRHHSATDEAVPTARTNQDLADQPWPDTELAAWIAATSRLKPMKTRSR
ncbi:MAG: hypothetical protein QOG10_1493, partial [Kribbellaceae bacterium]|nr:hypothetical protein [Kribbellaceae bacterium]